MEFFYLSLPNFSWAYLQTSSYCFYLSPHSSCHYPMNLSSNTTSNQLWPQSLQIRLCSSPCPLPSPRETFQYSNTLTLILFNKIPECLFKGTQNPAIYSSHLRSSITIEDILLFDSNTSSVCEKITMKKMIIVEKKTKDFFTHLLLYTRQSCLVCIHTSHIGQYLYLNYSITVVLSQLLTFNFLGRLLSYLVF